MGGTAHQLDFHAQLFGLLFSKHSIHFGIIQTLNALILGNAATLPLGIKMNHVVIKVINALKVATHANRPGHRRTLDIQYRFNFIHHLNGITDIAIHFVDESEDRRGAQTTHFHQFNGAILNTFGAVDHHQGRVNRRKRTVGIFREVFVTRCIQQIDDAAAVGELHHRGRYRDPPLLLHLHPV